MTRVEDATGEISERRAVTRKNTFELADVILLLVILVLIKIALQRARAHVLPTWTVNATGRSTRLVQIYF